MKNKIISIIIPHFNSIGLLKKLFITIPKKEDIEVIVIDDKSTNDIEEFNIMSKEKDFEHIIFLHNNTDKKGAGVCRNIGIRHAKGKWLLFADSDDYFTKNFYEVISSYFTSSSDVIFFKPTSVFIDTGEVADRHNRFCVRLENYLQNKDLKSELELRYKLDGPISKMINREFILENDISFEEVIASNDILFSSKVGFYMKKFEILEKTIYVITRSFNSLTVNTSEDIYNIRFNEKVKYYNFLKDKLSKDELKILNISFLDFLLKSMKYGSYKFLSMFTYIVKSRLPILDRRLLNPKSFFMLMKTMMRILQHNKKYGRSS